VNQKYALILGEFPPDERFIYCLDHIECGIYGHQSLLKPVNRIAGIEIKRFNLNEIQKQYWVLDLLDNRDEYDEIKNIKRNEGVDAARKKIHSHIKDIKDFIAANAVDGSMPVITIPAFSGKLLPKKRKRELLQNSSMDKLKAMLEESDARWALVYRELLSDKELNVASIFYSPWDEDESQNWADESIKHLKMHGIIN